MTLMTFLLLVAPHAHAEQPDDEEELTLPLPGADVRWIAKDRRDRARNADASVELFLSDEVGDPVGHALVLKDGLPVGETDQRGFLRVGGLKSGTTDHLVARHEYGTAAFHVLEDIEKGTTRLHLATRWQPGVVRIRVEDTQGEPLAATVDAASEHGLVTVAVGSSGMAVERLPEGDWTFATTLEDGQVLTQKMDVAFRLGGAQFVRLTETQALSTMVAGR